MSADDQDNLSTCREGNRSNAENEEKTASYQAIARFDLSFNKNEANFLTKKEAHQRSAHVDFTNFMTERKKNICIERRQPLAERKLESDTLTRPQAVICDEIRNLWFICDFPRTLLKYDLIKDKKIVLRHNFISYPCAVTFIKEGFSIALLCSRREGEDYFISTYSYSKSRGDNFRVLRSYDSTLRPLLGECRGLVMTHENVMTTIELLPNEKPCLRLFQITRGMVDFDCKFQLNFVEFPSHLAATRNRLAIADDRSQKVFILSIKEKFTLREFDKNPNSVVSLNYQVDLSTIMDLPQEVVDQPLFLRIGGIQFDHKQNMLILDSFGQTLKIFDESMDFLQRVSTDFIIPKRSHFWVTSRGNVMMTNQAERKKLIYGNMSSREEKLSWAGNGNMLPTPSMNHSYSFNGEMAQETRSPI